MCRPTPIRRRARRRTTHQHRVAVRGERDAGAELRADARFSRRRGQRFALLEKCRTCRCDGRERGRPGFAGACGGRRVRQGCARLCSLAHDKGLLRFGRGGIFGAAGLAGVDRARTRADKARRSIPNTEHAEDVRDENDTSRPRTRRRRQRRWGRPMVAAVGGLEVNSIDCERLLTAKDCRASAPRRSRSHLPVWRRSCTFPHQ